jgi:glycosyltransferase involved in cell wall biosynthesis
MLKVAFILESESSISGHYRVEANLDAFERAGIDAYPMTLPVGLRQHRKMAQDLAAFDVVVFVRALPGPVEFALLRRKARVVGYDFDDVTVLNGEPSADAASVSKRIQFNTVVANADFVTVADERLPELAGARPAKVFVVPTPVDTARYAPCEDRAGPPCIGWIGTRYTMRFLESILPAVERVAAARPGVTLTVISDAEPAKRPFVRYVKLEEEVDPAEVAALDMGLLPLPDTQWGRGQSGWPLALFGACGVAVVASPVGPAASMVVDGRTGLHAGDGAQWEKAILALLDDTDKRNALGRAARKEVEARYAADVVVPLWAGVIKEAIAQSRTGKMSNR